MEHENDPGVIECAINDNCDIQRMYPPDSALAVAAVERNRELFAFCEAQGWRYRTDNGYLTILAN